MGERGQDTDERRMGQLAGQSGVNPDTGGKEGATSVVNVTTCHQFDYTLYLAWFSPPSH